MEILRTDNLQYINKIDYPDISIKEGETVFIKGESGCGKSSLFKMLNITKSPSRGAIYYKDKTLESYDSINLRKEILLIGQTSYLFDKNIRENFDEFYKYRNQALISEEEMKAYLKTCCADFPLDTDCSILSGGEKQRVYLAIGISFATKVLLLDEPTSALDEKIRDKVITNIIKKCKEKNITLLIISHDEHLINNFGDKVIELTGGGINE